MIDSGYQFKFTPWVLFLLCAGVFWSSPSFADIYVYKKNNSFYITDTYQGPDYIKHYKTKKDESRSTIIISPKKKKYRRSDFSGEIYRASRKHGVNPSLITAIIEAESNFRPDAVSPKGAIGLMQIMPGTAIRFNVNDPFDPHQNIDGGTRYMRYLLSLFRGNMPLALAAYNAGENTVKKYGAIPPYKETTSYVRKVLSFFKSLESKKNSIY